MLNAWYWFHNTKLHKKVRFSLFHDIFPQKCESYSYCLAYLLMLRLEYRLVHIWWNLHDDKNDWGTHKLIISIPTLYIIPHKRTPIFEPYCPFIFVSPTKFCLFASLLLCPIRRIRIMLVDCIKKLELTMQYELLSHFCGNISWNRLNLTFLWSFVLWNQYQA